VLTRREGEVAYVVLNNPERLNAVSAEMYEALITVLRSLNADPGCRVIVLEGAGRAFCVGADLKAHAGSERSAAEKSGYVWLAQQVLVAIHELDKPLIASVHGHAYGAGAEMALNADFVVMERAAQMAFPEVSIGTYVGGGITFLLPRLVGLAKARELLLLGARFTGEQAEAVGLIHRAVDGADRAGVVAEIAQRLAQAAPIPMSLMRATLTDAGDPKGYQAALCAEAAALLRCMDTEDWREGAVAFGERRAPRFAGR
jgi:enoyl-CoA hydratase